MSNPNNKNNINLRDRIKNIITYISDGLKEKDEAIRLALLASIAGESIFYLGPPGTAKSMVSRRLRSAFKGENGKPLNYFEYLMNQFSTPDELFGPVSLKKLENDVYERITDGYLPKAEVAFLDEIWKASPAIQNTLLTIINEKKFHNGSEVVSVPLKALISASNELPAENQGLEALWDRFLLRLMVLPVQEEKNFLAVVCGKPVKAEIDEPKNAISISELKKWQEEIKNVNIPEEIQNILSAVWSKMNEKHNEHPDKLLYYISDRRWIKIAHLLQTSAFLNGRQSVDLMDCQLISHCIWNSDDVIEETGKIVEESIIEDGHGFVGDVDKIRPKIKSFDEWVTNNFYIDGVFKPKKYKMNDGTEAYRIVNPQKINSYNSCMPYYIAPDYKHQRCDCMGAYFDNNKERINANSSYDNYCYIEDDSFKISGDIVIWKDGYRGNNYFAKIEMMPTSKVKSPDLYGYNKRSIILYKMENGSKAYKLLEDVQIDIEDERFYPQYISMEYEHDGEIGAYFDEDKKIIGDWSENFYIKEANIFNKNDYWGRKIIITWTDGVTDEEYETEITMDRNNQEPKKFKMENGTIAYEIRNPSDFYYSDFFHELGYISVDYVHKHSSNKGMYFNREKKPLEYHLEDFFIKENSFFISDDVLHWTDGFSENDFASRVETKREFIKGDFQKLQCLTKKAESYYQEIYSSIKSTQEKIQEYINTKELQYKSNLFADVSLYDVIMQEINRAKDELSLIEEQLEKTRYRYTSLKPDED